MPNSLVLKIVSAIRIWGEGTFLLFFCFILMVSWTYLSFFPFSQVFVVYFPFMTSVPRLLSISPFSFYPTEWFSTLHSTLALPSEVVWPWPSHTPSRASLFSFVKWNGLVRNFLRFLPALTFSFEPFPHERFQLLLVMFRRYSRVSWESHIPATLPETWSPVLKSFPSAVVRADQTTLNQCVTRTN